MHWLDGVSARALARTPPHKRVFRRGWGDPEALDAYLAEAARVTPIPDLDVAEGPERTWEGLAGHDLTFESPGRYLPDAARTARALFVGPPGGTDRAVVLMASWNDQGYDGRRKLAADLAARGICLGHAGTTLLRGTPGRSRATSSPSPPSPTSCGWAAPPCSKGGCWPTTCAAGATGWG